MATDLTGLQVRNTYQSLLKIGDNSSLTGSPDVISDGFGNQSPLYLTTSQVSIGVVPATGYDFTVNSGIKTGYIDIVGAATAASLQFTGGTGTQGTMSWNTDEETVDLIQNGATLQLGQETHVHVKNQSGATINNGTPVYVTGTLGASGRLTVAPMIADGSIAAKYFLGVTTEDIPNGEDGKVTTFGKVRGLNTTAYTEGQTLFVSSTTAGFWQTTPPISPALDLETAIVINVNANNGTIFVRAQQGYYLGMLHDVYINGVSDGDLLVYDSANTRWKNESISGITNINLDTVTDNGNTTTNSISVGDINAGNVTLTGYLRGAANFVIDPAAHGDDTGTVQILGNLRVDGTTTTINSTIVEIQDKNIVLASDADTAGDANGAGITIVGANAQMTYNSTSDRFVFNKDIEADLIGSASLNVLKSGDTMTGDLTITDANINLSSGYALKRSDSYQYIPYITTTGSYVVGTHAQSAANFTIVADFDGTGVSEFFQVKTGGGTPNILKLLSKTTAAGVNNNALTLNGNIILNTANYSDTTDGRYYTKTQSDARYVDVGGDTMTGALTLSGNGSDMLFLDVATTANASDQNAIRYLTDGSLKAQIGVPIDNNRILADTVADDYVIKSWGDVRIGGGVIGTTTVIIDPETGDIGTVGDINADGNLTIDGNVTANVARFTATTGHAFGDTVGTARVVSFLNSGLAAGNVMYLTIGKDETTNNQGEISFEYVDVNSASNKLRFGLYGDPDMVTINGNGHLSVTAGNFAVDNGVIKMGANTVIDASRQATFTNATVGGTVSSNNFNTTGGSYNVDGTAVITSTGKFITDEIEGGTLNINGTTQINLRANGDLKAYVDATGFNVVGGLNLGGVDGISLTDEDSTADSFFHANVNYDAGLYQITSDARYGADYIQVDGNDTRTNTVFAISPKDATTTNPDLFLGGNNSITAPNTLTNWRNIKMNATSVQINNAEVATQSWVNTNTLSQAEGDARYLQLTGGIVTGNTIFEGVSVFKGQVDNYDGEDRSTYWNYDANVAMALEPAVDDGAVAIIFKSVGNTPSDFGYIVFDEDYGEAGVAAGENSALIIGCENDGLSSSDHVRVKGRLVVEADMSSSDPTNAFQVKSGNVTADLFKVSRSGDGYLNGNFEADGRGTFDNSVNVIGLDTGNPAASADHIRVSGYGILGNRGTFYVTNNGDVQIGNGSTHNADPTAIFRSSEIDLQKKVIVDSSQGITSSGWVHLHRYAENLNVAVGNNGTNVDLLVPNGNIGVGESNPSQKVVIDQGATAYNQGIPATTGTTQNGILRLQPGGSFGESLDFGMNVATTYAWIQATNKSNLSVNYSLALNPNGGNVGVSNANPAALFTIGVGDSIEMMVNSNQPRIDLREDSVYTGQFRTNNGVVILQNSSNNSLQLGTNATPRITVLGGGNVGVNEDNPLVQLHVTDNVEEVMRIESGTTGSIHFFEGITRRGIVGYSNGTSISVAADAGDMVFRAESGKRVHLSIGSVSIANVSSTGLSVDGSVNGDNIINSLSFATTDQRFKVILGTQDGNIITASIDDIVLSNPIDQNYIPYVVSSGGNGDTINPILDNSFLKINGSTLELYWGDTPGIYTERNLKMRKDGGGFGTYYQSTYGANSITFDHFDGSTTDTATISGTTNGSLELNVEGDVQMTVNGTDRLVVDSTGAFVDGYLRLSREGGVAQLHNNKDYANMPSGLVWREYNLTGTYAHASSSETLTDAIKSYTFVEQGLTSTVNGFTRSDDTYIVEFLGYYWAASTGVHQFSISSDDSGDIFIDGTRVGFWYGGHGDNDAPTGGSLGSNGGTVQTPGSIYLEKGFHRLYARFQEGTGGDSASLWHFPPSGSWAKIPADRLYHKAEDLIRAAGSSTIQIPSSTGINIAPETNVGLKIQSSGAGGSSCLRMFANSFGSVGYMEFPQSSSGMTVKNAGTSSQNAFGFLYGSSTVGSIRINSTSTSYNTTSDYRLKENVTEITDGIDRLKKLKPSKFNFIGSEEIVDGFIAHEAQEVVPEAVSGEKDGVDYNGEPEYQGIDQAKLVPLLTAALQEAIAKIESLEKRILTLENK